MLGVVAVGGVGIVVTEVEGKGGCCAPTSSCHGTA